ncbi:MAG: hypothetical protein AABX03_00325 [Nanoarchaeota archaeon]
MDKDRKWFKLNVYRAHQGTGRLRDQVAYIFAENVLQALNRYQKMPGIKRNLGRGHTRPVPDIVKLTEQQSSDLELKIANSQRVSLETAKRSWYYDL